MDIYDNLQTLPHDAKGAVIAIGNFDGVHRGHKALMAVAAEKAKTLGSLKVGVLTFEPHPKSLFRPDDPPFRITPGAMKARLLIESGADFIAAAAFDWDFASLTAEAFAALVKDSLAPAHIFVGEDFRFGQLRKGSVETLREARLSVTALAPVTHDGHEKYSSSAIREALWQGDIETANRLLGWDWEVAGEILRGDRRGHELGYPTANVALEDAIHPAYGIYAARVQIEGEADWRMAAVNIGIRPMFALKIGQVEAHILDMDDRDIYGKILRVRPVKRLRGEAKFASLDALVAQMDEDCREARKILSA